MGIIEEKGRNARIKKLQYRIEQYNPITKQWDWIMETSCVKDADIEKVNYQKQNIGAAFRIIKKS